MDPAPNPRVGVAVFVLNSEGKFIVGKRKGSHGAGTWSAWTLEGVARANGYAGTWALPGGHLEYGESWETCAERETLEETNLKIRDVRYLTATNEVFEAERKHYITIFMGSVCEEGAQPKVSIISFGFSSLCNLSFVPFRSSRLLANTLSDLGAREV